MSDCIYLDYHATTPVDPRVLEEMLPYFTQKFGNVASQHVYGQEVKVACDQARSKLASLIGAKSEEVIFTSGATESNNFAIKGVAEAMASKGRHIISCVTEHKSVLDTLKYLSQHGFAVTLLPVDKYGQVSPDDVREALRFGAGGVDRTVLVSLMGANNEIGTIHRIKEIGQLLAGSDIVFHVDGAQTVGKIPFLVKELGIDLLSMSGHKMYAPKGIGALYIDSTLCRSYICSMMHGGGQEAGLRAGTLAVPLVVAMGKAAEIAEHELAEEERHLSALRIRLWQKILPLGGIEINGHPSERLPGNLNLTFRNIDGDRLLLGLKGVAVSSTSACSSGTGPASHVLKAIGRSESEALCTLRFGIGRFTTDSEVDAVAEKLNELIPRLRRTQDRLQQKRLIKSQTA